MIGQEGQNFLLLGFGEGVRIDDRDPEWIIIGKRIKIREKMTETE